MLQKSVVKRRRLIDETSASLAMPKGNWVFWATKACVFGFRLKFKCFRLGFGVLG